MTLLAAYHFDTDTGTATDATGNGNDFAITTPLEWSASGHTAGGLSSDTGASTGTFHDPPIGQTNDRTVMMWAQGSGEVWYVRWQVDSIGSGAWGILLLSGNWGIQARNSSSLVRPSVADPADGQWHHIAGTYDGTTVRIYLDGTEQDSASLTGPLRTDADRVDGCEWNSGTTIDDLRIYDETLDQAAIQDAMNTPVGSATRPPAYVHDGTVWQPVPHRYQHDGTSWQPSPRPAHLTP